MLWTKTLYSDVKWHSMYLPLSRLMLASDTVMDSKLKYLLVFVFHAPLSLRAGANELEH